LFLNICHPDMFLNIYKVQIFSIKYIQFIVKHTFKTTCLGSTEPSSGLFVRTDLYPTTSIVEDPHRYIQQHIPRRNKNIVYCTVILKLTTSTVI